MKERNENIDILRALALLLIVVYHAWVLCGSSPIKIPLVNMILPLGGMIGVTAFFALSGYGIYCSLQRIEQKEKKLFRTFMKKRALRILPQYYICLCILLLFTNAAEYLSLNNIPNIITHIFFIHNLWMGYSGAINGALWTMGVIVQFYVIAIPLYKGMKKFGVYFWLLSIAATVAIKIIVFAYLIPKGSDAYFYFVYGRQLFTSLDNFVTGMAVAWFYNEKNRKLNWKAGSIVMTAGIAMTLAVCKLGLSFGIHTNNICGYLWHSGIAAGLGLIMLGFSSIPVKYTNPIAKFLLWVSKYEYGTYLWHLVLFYNLVGAAPIVIQLIEKGLGMIVIFGFTVLALFAGFLFTKMTDGMMDGYLRLKKDKVKVCEK